MKKIIREYEIISATPTSYELLIREIDASTLTKIDMKEIDIPSSDMELIKEYAQKHKEDLKKTEGTKEGNLIKTILQIKRTEEND